MSNVIDFSQQITAPALQIAGLVLTATIAYYVPRVARAIEDKIGISLTDQQNAALTAAIQTGAGVIETKLDQKAMDISHVTITNDNVRDQATLAINALGPLATSMNLTVEGVANAIVGATETGSRTPVSSVTNVQPTADGGTTTTAVHAS